MSADGDAEVNPAHFTLKPRDREICDLLINGADNETIASSTGLTVNTVKARMHDLYQLFDVPANLCRRVAFAVYMHAHAKHFGLSCMECARLPKPSHGILP